MSTFDDLNADEHEIVELIAERLSQGRETYGPLDIDTDRRDTLVESLEEIVDALVYLGVRLIKLQRKKERL